MEYIRLGQISKSFGLEGILKVYSYSDFAKQRFKKDVEVSLFDEKSGDRVSMHIASFRDAGQFYFLGFKELKSIDEAEKYLHYYVEIDKEKAPLPKGYYRLQDLRGCQVVDENDLKLGTVKEVLSYAPTKTLQVAREGGKDFYVPFIDGEFILNVDIDGKTIKIKVMPGLL